PFDSAYSICHCTVTYDIYPLSLHDALPILFGPELYDLFVRVKQSFDPSGMLNPGIKISDRPFTDHIDYVRLSKPCATCAKCNARSEEHTSELQSRVDLVCRLLLEKKNTNNA